jgi:regulatory protein
MALGWSTMGDDATTDDAELQPPQDPAARLQRALDAAYRYLSRRDRTVAEVRRHLETQRCEPDAIDQAVADLAEAGYLDDARYARTFAEDRRSLDAWGPDRIARKLGQLGIAAPLIEAALGDRTAEDELDAAVELLRQRLRLAMQDDRGRQRALGILTRRGYSLELAYDAIRRFEREAAEAA